MKYNLRVFESSKTSTIVVVPRPESVNRHGPCLPTHLWQHHCLELWIFPISGQVLRGRTWTWEGHGGLLRIRSARTFSEQSESRPGTCLQTFRKGNWLLRCPPPPMRTTLCPKKAKLDLASWKTCTAGNGVELVTSPWCACPGVHLISCSKRHPHMVFQGVQCAAPPQDPPTSFCCLPFDAWGSWWIIQLTSFSFHVFFLSVSCHLPYSLVALSPVLHHCWSSLVSWGRQQILPLQQEIWHCV